LAVIGPVPVSSPPTNSIHAAIAGLKSFIVRLRKLLEETIAKLKKLKSAAPSNPTGQIHHPISKPVAKALDKHPNLAGEYKPRDPRLSTQAADKAAHRGYQKWHRELDAEVSKWIAEHPDATKETFENWLRRRYSQPDLKARFPNGF
jgi:hypothetical protein